MKPTWDAEKAAAKEAANRASMLQLAAEAGVKVQMIFKAKPRRLKKGATIFFCPWKHEKTAQKLLIIHSWIFIFSTDLAAQKAHFRQK